MSISPLPLLPHPGDPSLPALTLHAAARPAAGGGLALLFRLEGRLDRLRLPPAGEPAVADALWRHTCFEAFVAAAGDSAYVEFNFAPDGRWACYRFSDYRQRHSAPDGPVPQLCWSRDGEALELRAELPAAGLPAGGDVEVSLSAIIEDVEGRHGHYALAHAAAVPDFHRREAFVLRLSRSSAGAGA